MLHCKKMLKKRDQAGEGTAFRTKWKHARFAHASIEEEGDWRRMTRPATEAV
jgi:hypothetical protein